MIEWKGKTLRLATGQSHTIALKRVEVDFVDGEGNSISHRACRMAAADMLSFDGKTDANGWTEALMPHSDEVTLVLHVPDDEPWPPES